VNQTNVSFDETLDRAEERILVFSVSDDALERASGMDGGGPHISANTTYCSWLTHCGKALGD
jgi:hypothetical protein